MFRHIGITELAIIVLVIVLVTMVLVRARRS